MKRLLLLLTMAAVFASAAPRKTTTILRPAALFDVSPPLDAMEQFIPDKRVTIHSAQESKAERQGALKGPGAGLGATPPTIPAGRGPGAAGRGARGGRAAAAAQA